MARDRQRAKQRRRRQSGGGPAARSAARTAKAREVGLDDATVEDAGLDRSRLHLTPGMTGHWQILGSARIPLGEMVGIDYLYVANWSLWTDVKILLRTVPYVLSRNGM